MSKMKTGIVSFIQWFDIEAGTNNTISKSRIDWIRCLPFLLIHIGCIGVLFYECTVFILLLTFLSYFIRMFAITAFYHRYFAHRAFKTSRVMQFLFAFLGGTAVQRGAVWWAAHHRKHHKYSDQPNDVHSPLHKGFFDSHCKWFLLHENFAVDKMYVQDLLKYPELIWLNRFDVLPPISLGIIIYLYGEYLGSLGYNYSGGQLFIFVFCVATTILYHCTFAINSIAHLFGNRKFNTKDNSYNNWILAIITLGEGWHNNHHYWPSSARQGFKIYEIDITYYLLKCMEQLKLISELRQPPKELL